MLSRKYRLSLSKNRQFAGQKFRCEVFDFVFKPNYNKSPRFAVIISKKVAKKAVVRNKIKRAILKALEAYLERIGGIDFLIIVRKDITKLVNFNLNFLIEEKLNSAGILK